MNAASIVGVIDCRITGPRNRGHHTSA